MLHQSACALHWGVRCDSTDVLMHIAAMPEARRLNCLCVLAAVCADS